MKNYSRPRLKEYIGKQAYIQLYDGRSFVGLLEKVNKLFILRTKTGVNVFFHAYECRKCRTPIDWSKV